MFFGNSVIFLADDFIFVDVDWIAILIIFMGLGLKLRFTVDFVMVGYFRFGRMMEWRINIDRKLR